MSIFKKPVSEEVVYDPAPFQITYIEGDTPWTATSLTKEQFAVNLRGEADEEIRRADALMAKATADLEAAKVESTRLRARAKQLRMSADKLEGKA